MRSFVYHRPDSIEEVSNLLTQSENSHLLSGGQTLLPKMRNRIVSPSDVIDVSKLLSKKIEVNETSVIVGSGVTHAELSASSEVKDRIPALSELASKIGTVQVRHRGTIGGSLAVNDPAADYPAACLALDAKIITDKRVIEAQSFFSGVYKTSLKQGEVILQVEFQVPVRSGWVKTLDKGAWPLVGVFVALLNSGARVAVIGAHNDGVFRHGPMESTLSKTFSAAGLVDIKTSTKGFRTTLQAGPEYRANLVDVLATRAINQANGVEI